MLSQFSQWFVFWTLLVTRVVPQAMIEEVNDRQLEKLIEENDFVAVAWFTKTCKYSSPFIETNDRITLCS